MFPLIFGILFLSCSSSDDSSSETKRTYADLQKDFSEINFTAGINDVSLLYSGDDYWDFRVILPEGDLTNNKRPLVITLHGAAGGNPDAHKSTGCFAEEGFAALNPIIISPNGGVMTWIEPYNQQMVLSLVDLASDYLPVDTSRIIVNGYSNGGNGSWFFGEVYPDIFSAAIPMASSYNTYNTDGQARYIATPMYVIHGENDELFPLEETQDWVNATVGVGSDITLEVAPGLTHNEPCEYVPYVKHAADWLLNEVW